MSEELPTPLLCREVLAAVMACMRVSVERGWGGGGDLLRTLLWNRTPYKLTLYS